MKYVSNPHSTLEPLLNITCDEEAINLSSDWRKIFENRFDVLCVTNKHWLQFPPPNHWEHVTLFVPYIIIMLIGVFGNGLVIYLICFSRKLWTASNLFILNLSISDFVMVSKISFISYNMFTSGPSTGKLGCDLYGFIGGLTGTCSIMTLAAISLDRYLVIAYPLDPFKKLSLKQVIGIICIIWMYAAVFSVIPLLGINGISYSPEGFLTTCSFDYLSEAAMTRAFIASFFVAAWVVPLIIITFSYLSILYIVTKHEKGYHTQFQSKLRKDSRSTSRQKYRFSPFRKSSSTTMSVTSQETPEENPRSLKHSVKNKNEKTELKLARIACFIVGIWVLAWTPYAIVALLGISGKKKLITPLSSMIPAIFCKTAACINPFIYALSHPRFKAELQRRLMRRNGPNSRSIGNFRSKRNQSIDSDFRSTCSAESNVSDMKSTLFVKSENDMILKEMTVVEINKYKSGKIIPKKDSQNDPLKEMKIENFEQNIPKNTMRRTKSLGIFGASGQLPIAKSISVDALMKFQTLDSNVYHQLIKSFRPNSKQDNDANDHNKDERKPIIKPNIIMPTRCKAIGEM